MLNIGDAVLQTTLNHYRNPTKSCRLNGQYGPGNSKYVGISHPLPRGHVTRGMRIELSGFISDIFTYLFRYLLTHSITY